MNPQPPAWPGPEDVLFSIGNATIELIISHMTRAVSDIAPGKFISGKFATALYDIIDAEAVVPLDVAVTHMALRLNISVDRQEARAMTAYCRCK